MIRNRPSPAMNSPFWNPASDDPESAQSGEETAMDDDVLYREEILEHYHSSPHRGRLEAPDLTAELDNPLCGDRIRLELGLDPEGRIDRVRFDGHGCAISQAAASLLAEHVEGKTAVEARWISAE